MLDLIIQFIKDPKLFNYLIITLYTINIVRWWAEGSHADAWYWASALSITLCVTFGYER